ncbi:MAG: hypothetical protein K5695_13190 [Oscillospiraceae bacterium]|nr:hypothetical protein [Oscillospiraceae bacterium]
MPITTISDLYNGTIPVQTVILPNDNKYQQLSDDYVSTYKTLIDLLDTQQLELFNRITDLQGRIDAMDAAYRYVQGFRDGAGIMLDVVGIATVK